MRTLIKYLMIAVLGFGLTMPQAALAQKRKVTIGGGQSSSKPKPKPKPESKPRSNQKPAPAPVPAPIPENQTFTVNGVTFTMIGVQGGTFTMGATAEQGGDTEDDEKPAHRVTLSSFYIGQTEVTQELWEAVMGCNPSKFKGAKLPVEHVSWNDCQEFIKKLNTLTGQHFRLPTEAEWEYAARGGSKSKGYEYSGSNELSDIAWWYDRNTHDVATKRPNELGLFDMSGNVSEWCQDRYGSYSSSSQRNPQGPASGTHCVCRGGSWAENNSSYRCRVSNRDEWHADVHNNSVGLRLTL